MYVKMSKCHFFINPLKVPIKAEIVIIAMYEAIVLLFHISSISLLLFPEITKTTKPIINKKILP